MAERPARRRSLQVQLDYAFDRWRESTLAQAYEILVPGRERLVGARIKESAHENGSDLRTGVLGTATPGLECVRDLAAEGQIQVVLAYAPDRLSRKYAYQILLIEELARHGVETLFVKSPSP